MEKNILKVFLYNNKLKFNEIEKITKIRSNKLSYYLKKLGKKEILIKKDEYYLLSETAEKLIPYITDKKSVLPVILIALKNKNQIFLYKREKRPYKNKLSLPGGRIILEESIKKASERIIKEKFNIKCKFKEINSVSLEHVKKNKKTIHSFFLILVTATTKDKINYTNIQKNKNKIISSDYKLMTNNLNSKTNIKTIISNT